eukprot:767164-Hanusia_phi.AAC.2
MKQLEHCAVAGEGGSLPAEVLFQRRFSSSGGRGSDQVTFEHGDRNFALSRSERHRVVHEHGDSHGTLRESAARHGGRRLEKERRGEGEGELTDASRDWRDESCSPGCLLELQEKVESRAEQSRAEQRKGREGRGGEEEEEEEREEEGGV